MFSWLVNLFIKPIVYFALLASMTLLVFHYYPFNINYKHFKSGPVIQFAADYVDVETEPGIVLRVAQKNLPNEKPTILFIHGFCESAQLTWHNQMDYFANLGYHVIAPDMRGYNDSSKPLDVESYMPERLLNDVQAVIQKLSKGKVVLVAHDWGAIVASWFASQRPQFVERLVLLNLGHMNAQQRISRGELVGYRQLLKSWYVFYFQLPFAVDRLMRNDFEFTIYLGGLEELAQQGLLSREQLELNKQLLAKQLPSAILYYRALGKHAFTQPAMQLPPFQMPVLILFGEQDAYLCHESADLTMREYIAESAKSKSKLIKLPKVGHWVTVQASDAVNKHMLEFISQ